MRNFKGSLLTRTVTGLSIFALLLIVAAVVIFDRLVGTPLLQRAASDKAALIVLSAQTWLELPADRRVEFAVALSLYHGLVISDVAEDLPELKSDARYYRLLTSELTERLGEAITLYEADGNIWVDMPSQTPYDLQIGFDSELPHQQQLFVAGVVFAFAAIIVVGASIAVVRYVARPLDRVSGAAGVFRGGTGFTPLPEIGPHELVSLTRNFNQMATEISELLENRTTLLAGVSHDLRSPLTRIVLELDRAKEGMSADLLGRLGQNIKNMQSLLNNVTEFAHGTVEPQTVVKLRELLVSILDGFSDPIEYEWNGNSELEVEIAPTVFERVLTNLITNAQQHATGCHLKISVKEEAVDLHVLDKGGGIPPDERQKVFQPFYRREKSRSSTSGGSGLGLAIVYQLCQLHQWQVSISAREGGGSDILVQIPLGTDQQQHS